MGPEIDGVIMKKKIYFVVVLFLFVISACFAKSINLSSLKYSFEVPDGYSTDSTYIASRYQYFAAHHPQDTIVITVTSIPYNGKGLESMSSTEVQKFGQTMQEQYKPYGISVLSCTKYYSNGITFLNVETKLGTAYQIQFSAVKGTKFTNFTFTFKSTPTTVERAEVLAVVKSIKNI